MIFYIEEDKREGKTTYSERQWCRGRRAGVEMHGSQVSTRARWTDRRTLCHTLERTEFEKLLSALKQKLKKQGRMHITPVACRRAGALSLVTRPFGP